MAKQPPTKGGTSRIRFIMLEAEIPDGDLSQITTAIQNALKPTTIIQQRLAAHAPAAALTVDAAEAEQSPFMDEQAEEEEAAAESETPRKPRSVRPRKFKTPEVIEVDLTSDVSWGEFAGRPP